MRKTKKSSSNRKLKVSNDSSSSFDTQILDQNFGHGPGQIKIRTETPDFRSDQSFMVPSDSIVREYVKSGSLIIDLKNRKSPSNSAISFESETKSVHQTAHAGRKLYERDIWPYYFFILHVRRQHSSSSPKQCSPKQRSLIQRSLGESPYSQNLAQAGIIQKNCGIECRKRLPCMGSNISKPPTLSEVPEINNPTAWISSNVKSDTKPIKSW